MTPIKVENDRLPLTQTRSSLAKLWFCGAAMIFVLLIIQSVLGKYGDDLQDVWSWFIPTTIPTLSLMIGVIGANALEATDKPSQVNRFFYQLTWWLSLIYLLILFGTIVIEPVVKKDSFELFKLSNYWLTPLQGLVVAVMGFLFSSKSSSQKASSSRKKPAAPSKDTE